MVSSPLRAGKASVGYLASRSFDDISMSIILCLFILSWLCPVPVYDGRASDDRPAFKFNNTDFKRLSSWPLYRKGLVSELPLDATVSVGYSLGTYKGASGTVLSSNLQFVILLSTGK